MMHYRKERSRFQKRVVESLTLSRKPTQSFHIVRPGQVSPLAPARAGNSLAGQYREALRAWEPAAHRQPGHRRDPRRALNTGNQRQMTRRERSRMSA
eukprot:6604107-Pyramimonas_sp.AAC.1